MCGNVHGLASIYGDLRAFNDFVRSLDEMVDTIALRRRDRASLYAAVDAIERAIDDRARRPPRHPETHAIAKDLKETRIAALRQRFAGLSSVSVTMRARPASVRNRIHRHQNSPIRVSSAP